MSCDVSRSPSTTLLHCTGWRRKVRMMISTYIALEQQVCVCVCACTWRDRPCFWDRPSSMPRYARPADRGVSHLHVVLFQILGREKCVPRDQQVRAIGWFSTAQTCSSQVQWLQSVHFHGEVQSIEMHLSRLQHQSNSIRPFL